MRELKRIWKVLAYLGFLLLIAGSVIFVRQLQTNFTPFLGDAPRYLVRQGSWKWSDIEPKPSNAVINDMRLHNDSVYITYHGEGGLEILDVSSPRTPQSLDRYYDEFAPEGVVVQDQFNGEYMQYAYLYGMHYLDVLNVTDLTNICKIGSIEGLGNITSAAYHSNYLYVFHNNLSTNELEVYNVSIPSSPEWVSEVVFPGTVFNMKLDVNNVQLVMMVIDGDLMLAKTEDLINGNATISHTIVGGLRDGFLYGPEIATNRAQLLYIRRITGFDVYSISRNFYPYEYYFKDLEGYYPGDIAVIADEEGHFVLLTDYNKVEIIRPWTNLYTFSVGSWDKRNRAPDQMTVVENYVYVAFNDDECPELLILKFQSRAPWLIPVLSSVFLIAIAALIWLNIHDSRTQQKSAS